MINFKVLPPSEYSSSTESVLGMKFRYTHGVLMVYLLWWPSGTAEGSSTGTARGNPEQSLMEPKGGRQRIPLLLAHICKSKGVHVLVLVISIENVACALFRNLVHKIMRKCLGTFITTERDMCRVCAGLVAVTI